MDKIKPVSGAGPPLETRNPGEAAANAGISGFRQPGGHVSSLDTAPAADLQAIAERALEDAIRSGAIEALRNRASWRRAPPELEELGRRFETSNSKDNAALQSNFQEADAIRTGPTTDPDGRPVAVNPERDFFVRLGDVSPLVVGRAWKMAAKKAERLAAINEDRALDFEEVAAELIDEGAYHSRPPCFCMTSTRHRSTA